MIARSPLTIAVIRFEGTRSALASAWSFQFVDNGDVVRLLAEEFDRVRIIHLQGPAGEVTPSPLGHSVGYWEERSLIVNTTHINSMSFNGRNTPDERER